MADGGTVEPLGVQTGVDLEALSDLCTPWCVHVVATLRIAEHLASGTGDVAALAAAARCDADALDHVLGHLAGKGVFTRLGPGRYALNDAARGLLEPSRFLDLDGIGGRFARAWGSLLPYVRSGAPAYEEIFGRPFWEDLDAHPDVAADFDALIGPAGHGTPDPQFALTGGWDGVRTVVDVGGGTGALLAEVLRARPGLDGTLVDLPSTVARGAETFQRAGVADRVTLVGQSFFDPLPAGADLYLLRKVLNDWPDRERRRSCAGAPTPPVPPDAWWCSAGWQRTTRRHLTIEMVLLGGRTDSLAEFGELAGRAGLEVVAAGQQPAGFVVECRPG